jgi:hypothetical protein
VPDAGKALVRQIKSKPLNYSKPLHYDETRCGIIRQSGQPNRGLTSFDNQRVHDFRIDMEAMALKSTTLTSKVVYETDPLADGAV